MVSLAFLLGGSALTSESTGVCSLLKGTPVDTAAYRAATYPFNLRQQPTDGQKTAGNYPKGHLTISGIKIAIENPAYSKRRPEWPELKAHYGYIKRTEGADGDQVDVFIKPGTHDDWNGPVFVVNQLHPARSKGEGAAFDEHKVMIGWPDYASAKQGYLDNYSDGWTGFGSMAELTLEEFKRWLKREDTTVPHPAGKANLGELVKGDVDGHEFHGNQWTGGGGALSEKPYTALDRALIDIKTDRPLNDRSKTEDIKNTLPNAEFVVPYSQVPFFKELNRLQGSDPKKDNIKDYVNARRALFEKQPEERLKMSGLVFTQSVVNSAKIKQNIEEKKNKEAYVVRYQGKDYVMDGHHTIVARAQRGKTHVNARVLTIGPTKKIDLSPLVKYDEDQPRDDHGRWGSGGGMSQKDGKWVDASGKPTSAENQARLDGLKVPPAWTDVKLNVDPKAELQVVGKDSKGRAQYLYSAEHSEKASAEKFARLQDFNKAAPEIIASARETMSNEKLPTEQRDAAAVVSLIAATGFRIGSDNETGAAVKAYGATTLQGQHVSVKGDTVQFSFTGKKGVQIEHEVTDARLASYIGSKNAGNGDRLFATNDAAVRDYFHTIAGDDFKVKDFRTWNGTATAIRAMNSMPTPKNEKEFAKSRLSVARTVAAHLGNTPTVALQSYIDPAVFGKWKGNFKHA